jgi:hypothetical protein
MEDEDADVGCRLRKSSVFTDSMGALLGGSLITLFISFVAFPSSGVKNWRYSTWIAEEPFVCARPWRDLAAFQLESSGMLRLLVHY